MTTNAIAIARELVNKGGADEKLANAIAEVVVTHSDANSASKAELARVEAEAKADRQARAEKESNTKEDISQIKLILNKIENRLTRLETSFKLVIGLLFTVLAGVAVLVIDKIL